MKKLFSLILLLFYTFAVKAQVVTTSPLFPTEGVPITITFDATKGTAGLQNFSGDIYAHTGVITDKSNGVWTYVKADWNVNTPACKLTSLGNNRYSFTINDIRTFYGVPSGETILKMAFVFRGASGSPEGKGDAGTDIFCPVYASGLQLAWTAPTTDMLIKSQQSITFSATASAPSTISLAVNGAVISSVDNATSISFSHPFQSPGSYNIEVKAISGGNVVTANRLITYKGEVVYQPIPANMVEGINYSADGTSATLVLGTPIRRNYDSDKVTDVYVLGDFNNWTPSAKYMMYRSTSTSEYNDSWWLNIPDLIPGKEYGFQYLVSYVDGTSKRIADPYSQKIQDPWNDKWINQNTTIYPGLAVYPDGKTTDIVSVLQPGKPVYNWQTTNFVTPDKKNLVIYEMLLRDFTSERTLRSAIYRLDYLKTLGVNAIELMPICEFDGNNSWGYNPCFYFATDKAYGTESDYKTFIDECHKRGIAVILDIVLNHATGNNPMAKLYWNSVTNKTSSANPWFNVDAPHPYSVFSDFKHGYIGTQNFFTRVMKYWIDEYKIDGYRLDLSKGLTDNPSTESTAANFDQTRTDNITTYFNAAKSAKSDVIFILEHFCDNAEETALSNAGMLLWNNMNGDSKAIAKGQNADWSRMNTYNQVAYMESHDEERIAYEAITNGFTANSVSDTMKQLSAEAALFLSVPGSKMIWQFGELGYDVPLGSGDVKMEMKPAKWEYKDVPERKQLCSVYSHIANLRSKYPNAFINPTSVSRSINSSYWASGKSLTLVSPDLSLVVVSNLLNTSINVNVIFPKNGVWYDLMTGNSITVSNSQNMVIPANSFIYYIDKQTTFPSVGIQDVVTDSSFESFYDAESSQIMIKSSQDVSSIKIYSVNGTFLKEVSNKSTIDASGLFSGCYLVRALLVNGTQKTFKIIK